MSIYGADPQEEEVKRQPRAKLAKGDVRSEGSSSLERMQP